MFSQKICAAFLPAAEETRQYPGQQFLPEIPAQLPPPTLSRPMQTLRRPAEGPTAFPVLHNNGTDRYQLSSLHTLSFCKRRRNKKQGKTAKKPDAFTRPVIVKLQCAMLYRTMTPANVAGNFFHHFLYCNAAAIKSRNSGWAFVGRDLNSGWN